MAPRTILLLTIMLATAAKAFVTRSVPCRATGIARFPPAFAALTRYPRSSPVAQSMSTNSDGSETQRTVVGTCQDKISAALETSDVKVLGAYDDPNGSHISIEVVSEKFEGKRAVQRQQMVYKAIWEEMQGAVHAVDSMVCKTPAEK